MNSKHTYTLEPGRVVMRDGTRFAVIHRIETMPHVEPSDVDDFAHTVVLAVNNFDAMREALTHLTDVMERVGPPKIKQGGLCEEEDWTKGMSNARAVLSAIEEQGQ